SPTAALWMAPVEVAILAGSACSFPKAWLCFFLFLGRCCSQCRGSVGGEASEKRQWEACTLS
ncbi:MAG: hypothetical protein ACPIOQ_84225, partial [Promethearchaeia archaeon]